MKGSRSSAISKKTHLGIHFMLFLCAQNCIAHEKQSNASDRAKVALSLVMPLLHLMECEMVGLVTVSIYRHACVQAPQAHNVGVAGHEGTPPGQLNSWCSAPASTDCKGQRTCDHKIVQYWAIRAFFRP
jgi:hypothetical protein